MNTKREFVNIGTLATEIEDANLRIRYTTIEAGFWVGLLCVNIHCAVDM